MKRLITFAALSTTHLLGGVLLSNFDRPHNGDYSYHIPDAREAVGFEVGDGDVLLGDVTLRLMASTNSIFEVSLYSAANFFTVHGRTYNTPGQELAQFGNVTVFEKGDYVFTAPIGVVLQANTFYWIVSHPISGSGWKYSESQSEFGIDGPAPTYSSDYGAVFFDLAYRPAYDPDNWYVHSGTDFIEILAIPIPEPAHYGTLLGLAASAFIMLKRNRTRNCARFHETVG